MKHNFKTACVATLFILVFMTIVQSHLFAQVVRDSVPELQKIDIVEHLGEQVPLDLTFTNDAGEVVKLDDYFHQGKPVILTLAYYNCPMLCTVVLNGLSDGIRGLDLSPEKDFTVLTVSINPLETPELASAKRSRYMQNLGDKGMNDGWRFFVGQANQSQKLADAVGFKFYYDEDTKEYAHAAGAFVLTEDGVISRYLYGLEFKERDLKLALLEASQGKIGSTLDRLILYCFHYDPSAKGYVVMAGNVMKLGGLATLIILTIFLSILWARERSQRTIRPAA